ncbi:MAG: hypothetical protein DWI22_03735 [Planctomycetota bacterium]|nr:MAG: hypothetical protein DWI22_03735 [Planctomycetota bacterium]
MVACSRLRVLFVIFLMSGCQEGRTNADFIPSSGQSQEALTVALDAWKAGIPSGPVPATSPVIQPSGPVPATSPVIHVTDSSRISGQTLDDYQILGEVPGNAERCFAVKLKLSNPTAEKRERYVIVGIDPLWIFRQEDYDLLLHWEHQMPPARPEDSAVTLPESSEENGDSKRESEVFDSVTR